MLGFRFRNLWRLFWAFVRRIRLDKEKMNKLVEDLHALQADFDSKRGAFELAEVVKQNAWIQMDLAQKARDAARERLLKATAEIGATQP